MRTRYILAALWFAITASFLITPTVWWLVEGRERNESFPSLMVRWVVALTWPLLMLTRRGRVYINKKVFSPWL